MGDTPVHDVVVLGTGAAGLSAALSAHEAGASVGLYERSEVVGGTSAISGGIVWVPNHPHLADAGATDSREDALAYLDSLSLGVIDPELATVLVDEGPRLVEWLEEHTPLRLRPVPGFPDYHPENPGGKPGGGRSLDPGLFAFDELGEWAGRVARPVAFARRTMMEAPLGGGTGSIPREVLDERNSRDVRGGGQALIGSLLRACLDRGIEPVTGARALKLIIDDDDDDDDDGRVAGVEFEPDGPVGKVTARRGVVIATGGFEWNPQLVRAFLRGPMTSPTGVPTNTGDGLQMAIAAGAALGVMAHAWWVPTIEIPGEEMYGRKRARLVLRERTLPRSIMVNRKGRRFADEAANYNALGGAFHQFDPARFEYGNLPCWLVFDHEYLRLYGFVDTPPGDESPPPYVVSAPTLEALGGAIGVPADALTATVAHWNEMVANGHDDDFERGDSAYDRWSGDQRFLRSHAATLGPLDQPPYYAVEIHSGTLGTKGGPSTNTDAQVVDIHGSPIAGLYAAGNAMAAPTGLVYGGAGGTLGPAMVFGFIAGRHAGRTPN